MDRVNSFANCPNIDYCSLLCWIKFFGSPYEFQFITLNYSSFKTSLPFLIGHSQFSAAAPILKFWSKFITHKSTQKKKLLVQCKLSNRESQVVVSLVSLWKRKHDVYLLWWKVFIFDWFKINYCLLTVTRHVRKSSILWLFSIKFPRDCKLIIHFFLLF